MEVYINGNKIVNGSVFGHLVVRELFHKRENGGSKRQYARCICVCGKEWDIRAKNLGRSTSCGCKRGQSITKQKTKHGYSKGEKSHLGYTVWCGMRRRCKDPRCERYPNYGGRGISVCQRWEESFEAFIGDMGDRPSSNHSIERIDNDGDYCPENCRWATTMEQARNKTNNRFIEFNGMSLTLAEWSRRIGVEVHTLHSRLKRGWNLERALTEPLNK